MKYIAIISVVAMLGCATKKPTAVPPVPTMVASKFSVASLQVAPAKSPVIGLAWDKNEPGALTEVWGWPSVADWMAASTNAGTLHTNVAESDCVLPASQPMEFFRVRNRIGDRTSEWNK